MEADPLDSLLGLEDQYYNEGFTLGTADGVQAGLVEGRLFGLEKGFEKFINMGRLHGQSIVWASRLPSVQASRATALECLPLMKEDKTLDNGSVSELNTLKRTTFHGHPLPLLPSQPRLKKHIQTFHALVEMESVSVKNDEDSVSEFDDRLKRAGGKSKIIEKLIGEYDDNLPSDSFNDSSSDRVQKSNHNSDTGGNIEDISSLRARH